MLIWCDRLITGGILFLTLFTPFAFGAVHPWAYATMEVIVFALVVVWMIKLLQLSREHGGWSGEQVEAQRSQRVTSLVLPLALFIGFVLFQLLPLPPGLLRMISPNTFDAYTQLLPGWPERVPYGNWSEVGGQRSEVSNEPEVRDHKSKVGRETPEERVAIAEPNTTNANEIQKSQPISINHGRSRYFSFPESWLPLSLVPWLSRI